jgi:HD superfamily phosphohydrolase YqeK
MKSLAHTENSSGTPHRLSNHLRQVARLARQFAEEANPALGDAAEWTGWLHDLEKCDSRSQVKLWGEHEGETVTPLAKESVPLNNISNQYPILQQFHPPN